jgi:hypothetical protein
MLLGLGLAAAATRAARVEDVGQNVGEEDDRGAGDENRYWDGKEDHA